MTGKSLSDLECRENELRNRLFDYNPEIFNNLSIKYKIYWVDQCLSYVCHESNNLKKTEQINEVFSYYGIININNYLLLKFNIDQLRLNDLIASYEQFINEIETIDYDHKTNNTECFDIKEYLSSHIEHLFKNQTIDILLSNIILKNNLGCLGRCFYRLLSDEIVLFFDKNRFGETIRSNTIDEHFFPVFFHELGHKIFWEYYINNKEMFCASSIAAYEFYSEIFAFSFEHFLYSKKGLEIFKATKHLSLVNSSFQSRISKKIIYNAMSIIYQLQDENIDNHYVEKHASFVNIDTCTGSFRDIQYFAAKSVSIAIRNNTSKLIISGDWNKLATVIFNLK